MKKLRLITLITCSFLIGFAVFNTSCEKEKEAIALDKRIATDQIFQDVIRLNVEASRPAIRKLATIKKEDMNAYADKLKAIQQFVDQNHSEADLALAVDYLGYSSVDEYNKLKAPVNEKIAALYEKYPELNKMTNKELNNVFTKALGDDHQYADMMQEEFSRQGVDLCHFLNQTCLLAVQVALIVGKGYLCTPLGFPLGTLCSLGLDLAGQIVTALCGTLFNC